MSRPVTPTEAYCAAIRATTNNPVILARLAEIEESGQEVTLDGTYWAAVAAAKTSTVERPRTRPAPVEVQVLVGEEWVDAMLTSWERRGPDWYGNVTYTRDITDASQLEQGLIPITEPGVFTWEQIRPAREIRQRP